MRQRPTFRPRNILTLLTAVLLAGPLTAQSPRSTTATRAERAPVIDGRGDDAVWLKAPVVGGFRQWRPTEDADPVQRTEFKVAYDAEYLYVFVRAYDTHPDSIISQLARRDEEQANDEVVVMLDAYHDHRTGYEFRVNPSGVKTDLAIYNDEHEDTAWDAIWDVATRIDSLGWTAEYRIPFSQLRFAPTKGLVFGFAVWRNLQRSSVQSAWPLYRQSMAGLVSQAGELTGLDDLANPRRAEIAPYLLTQNEERPIGTGFDRHQKLAVGGDLKYAVAPNLTLNATVNPDFGQVEADPGELNLSAFETFFSEHRPFFVAGAGQFDFKVNCFVVLDCNTGEGLFYSRRIGRAPLLADQYGDATSPTSTRILGAAKLTGRSANGLSVGFLDAVTQRVSGIADHTIEPMANYAVMRVNQDYAAGNGSLGMMLTGVNRSLDASTEDFMHRSAYSGGFDARRRFGRFEFSGALMGSAVAGTATAIASTQENSTHYYQRPDDNLAFDSIRTSLSGSSTELRVAKVGGQHLVFESGYARRSAGFEINDIGFLQQANQQAWNNWMQFRFTKPNKVYQRLNWNLNYWQYWTLEGLETDHTFSTNIHTQFNNRMWLHLGGSKGLEQTYCDRNCTRGGPALRVEPQFAPWGGIEGDDRNAIVPSLWFNYRSGDGGRTHFLNLNPQVTLKVATRFLTTLSANVSHNRDDSQWFGNFTDHSGVTHYTFAALDQRTVGLTMRLNYTFSPTTSFQLYANPFISKGEYSRVREVTDARAARYDDRFTPYGDPTALADNPGFNVKQLRTNAVFRWEYRPGSALFLVWSQGRQSADPTVGNNNFGGDLSNLLSQHADNRFLVKISYWFNR